MVQCLGLCAFTAKSLSSIPGQGTKIPQASSSDQLKKKKKDTELCSQPQGELVGKINVIVSQQKISTQPLHVLRNFGPAH